MLQGPAKLVQRLIIGELFGKEQAIQAAGGGHDKIDHAGHDAVRLPAACHIPFRGEFLVDPDAGVAGDQRLVPGQFRGEDRPAFAKFGFAYFRGGAAGAGDNVGDATAEFGQSFVFFGV